MPAEQEPGPTPDRRPIAAQSKAEQQQREATALRENLRRRKQQVQARTARPMTSADGDSQDT